MCNEYHILYTEYCILRDTPKLFRRQPHYFSQGSHSNVRIKIQKPRLKKSLQIEQFSNVFGIEERF